MVPLLYHHRPPRATEILGSRATLNAVKPAAPNPIPTAETPALTDEERVRRLRLLAERLRNPDGLDRGTLAQIEQLTGDLE
jgi:hypothetical protein